MIKVKEDFIYKLQQANQNKDRQALSDLLIPKIADLINNDRDEVIILLRDSGVKVPDNVSRKQLAILVADNAGIRPKVADGLSFMIARNNGTGVDTEGGVSNFVGELIGAISAPITSIFNAKAAGEQTKAIEDSNRTALLLAVLKQQNAGPSATTIVVGSLLVLTAAAVIYFAFIRKKE